MHKVKCSLAFLALMALFGCENKPIKADMAEVFAQNKDDFLKLSSAVCREVEQSSIVHFVYPVTQTASMSNPVLEQEFSSFFQSKSLESASVSNNPCSIYLSVWAVGAFGEGQQIGFEYNPKAVHLYTEDFRDINIDGAKGDIIKNIPLADGWYLTYTYTP